MLERYESDTSKSALELTDCINEAIDSIKTIVAFGRESETMRLLAVKARAAPLGGPYLMLGACSFALAQAMVMWMGALMFYRASQRIAANVVCLCHCSKVASSPDQIILPIRVSTRFMRSSKQDSSQPSLQVDSLHFWGIMLEQLVHSRL